MVDLSGGHAFPQGNELFQEYASGGTGVTILTVSCSAGWIDDEKPRS
jgi:hypothetical protein